MLIKFLACMGIVWIIKDSYLLYSPREYLKSKSQYLNKLLSCSMCLGFWFGVLLSFLIYLDSLFFSLNLLYYPFAVSAFCWFFDSVLDLVQYSTAFIKSKIPKPNV